jgi:hypothetical protein
MEIKWKQGMIKFEIYENLFTVDFSKLRTYVQSSLSKKQ